MSPKISLVAAMAEKNRVIGKNGALPWHLPEDLAHFKALTLGKAVIMGRKTYESLPEKFRPLPGRRNFVISSSPASAIPAGREGGRPEVHTSPESVLAALEKDGVGEAFVIGGSQIYATFLEKGLADTVWLSSVPGDHSGDAFFPVFEEGFEEVSRTPFETFELIEYRKKP